MKFTKSQLGAYITDTIRIPLPSGALQEISRTHSTVWLYYLLPDGRVQYCDEVYGYSTLAQILRALVQEGSKIPEEDQDYLKGLLPRERKRSPRHPKNPDTCPFCGSLGELTGYPWGYHYIVCPNCQARTGDALSVKEAWELWRRRT